MILAAHEHGDAPAMCSLPDPGGPLFPIYSRTIPLFVLGVPYEGTPFLLGIVPLLHSALQLRFEVLARVLAHCLIPSNPGDVPRRGAESAVEHRQAQTPGHFGVSPPLANQP
jgi:hypothetical protein